jgi:hypothetical protein
MGSSAHRGASLSSMRPRTKIELPNPSPDQFQNFDRFVKIVLAKGKPAKKPRKEAIQKPVRPE